MKLYAGLAILGCMAVLALLAPGLVGHDPFMPDLFNRYAAPSAAHWLGTDDLGRDVLLRLLHGARVSLAVGLGAALMALLVGGLAGVLAAWAGGALAGSIQIDLAMPESQPHCAMLQDWRVDPAMRRQGVGQALLARAEQAAARLGRRLLSLETPAGWREAGRIPGLAMDAAGRAIEAVRYIRA